MNKKEIIIRFDGNKEFNNIVLKYGTKYKRYIKDNFYCYKEIKK